LRRISALESKTQVEEMGQATPTIPSLLLNLLHLQGQDDERKCCHGSHAIVTPPSFSISSVTTAALPFGLISE
jgi:hypothetical protein